MKNILITGSNGKIGKILASGLSRNYKLTLADLPEEDLRNYSEVLKLCAGKDTIVHLAWKAGTENFKNGKIDFDNALMFYNVYNAALETKVPKLIMASSVHADNFRDREKGSLMNPYSLPTPTSPYGADKIFMEALGKHYSNNKLKVVCIRFGAVGKEKPLNEEEKILWFSPNDCLSLIKSIIESEKFPEFSIIYGISDNTGRIHDLTNPFGWKPRKRYKNVS